MMKLGRHHMALVMAFAVYLVAGYASLYGLIEIFGQCMGDGHTPSVCRAAPSFAALAFHFTVLIGGAWLIKRLATKLRIEM